MKLDILAFGAHPDDTELNCTGLLLESVKQGKRVGVVDLTKGEMGTRGNPELRMLEAQKAAEIIGLAVRENVGLADTLLENTRENQVKIITYVRRYKPDSCIITAPTDRHPDHGKAHQLLKDALFYSGLRKIETFWEGEKQEPWRPFHTFAYIQDTLLEPDVIVDISVSQAKKEEAILAFGSQIMAEKDQSEPQTYISGSVFFESVRAKARLMGHRIGVEYGEGYLYLNGPMPLKDLSSFEQFKPIR